MEVLHPRCSGLDVHKRNVVACVRIAHGGTIDDKPRTFETTTEQLLALGDWLDEHHAPHAAVEATGVYWKPVWYALDNGERTLTLGNAAHIQNVPGRKTDVNDAQWLADLHAHGLIRDCFVPAQETRDLRDLTRTPLVREKTSHIQRLQKVLF